MQKRFLYLLTAAMIFSLTACGNKDDNNGVVEVNEGDLPANAFIQMEEDTGRFYTINEDGTKAYLDETEDDSSEEDIEKFTGDITFLDMNITVPEGWYATFNGSDIDFYMDDADDSALNSISITTWENADITSREDMSAEIMNDTYEGAVENEYYKSYEFVGTEETSIGDSPVDVYKCKLWVTEDDLVNTTIYTIEDTSGGHVMMVMDQEDDIDINSAAKLIFNSISFDGEENE